MALTSAEVARAKYELGYNVLAVGAEPFIGISALFEQVIAPYITSGASTTSSTAVTAATAPTVVAITLANSAGFAAGDRVIVDVEDAQEITTLRSLSGSVASVFLSKAHPAGYPVTVEGGEAIVREILGHLRRFSEPRGLLISTSGSEGVKKVDEIEFFDRSNWSRELRKEQAYWRDELASALGCENRRGTNGGGSSVAMY